MSPLLHRPTAPARPSLACLLVLLLSLATPAWAAAEPTPSPEADHPLRTPARDDSHWSFQPLPAATETLTRFLHHQPTPQPTPTALDQFIVAPLHAKGLRLGPEADRPTLIRRLSFDLLGLPPSPAEIDAFVNDRSPHAYEQLVDRLLNSPRYGERWARHWLDVVRFTESQGFEYDRLRDHAWHYRDYVIRSFNEDLPYDQFMREQIAGDALEPTTPSAIIAASLLVCGPYDEAGNAQANATQKAITREDELEDLVGVVGQTFLGLTINCARCHSHKFDPIPLEDYYRVKAVFDGVKHGERPIASAAETQAHEHRAKPLQARVQAEQQALQSIEAETRRLTLAQIPIPPAHHATQETARLRLETARKELAALPPLPVSYAGRRVEPPTTHVLRRGDVRSPGEAVTPGALSALTALPPDLGLGTNAPEAQRRLRFADWLAHPKNPLPARVMANRIWHFHFGQGLVNTPNDFGASGSKPTHPELLDWLAATFVENGWSVKSLHRLILASATYRQSSQPREQALTLDADNLLLWRFPPRRLEAEALRDAVLAVSGQLNLRLGGPSFRPFDILQFPANAYLPTDKPEPDHQRRTVYRMNVNSGKDPLLDAFDCPDPSVKTPRRGITTTPLQALGLMNGSFLQRNAAHLAQRAHQEAGPSPEPAIRHAYRLALGRFPTDPELSRALAATQNRSLTNLCWALLNATEFVYVR